MNSLIDDLKNAWNKPNNSLIQLIIINAGIFVALVLINFFCSFGNLQQLGLVILEQFSLPSDIGEFLGRPWTIITYAFSHDLGSMMHILFNMLVMYWFGQLIVEFLGHQKLINLYVLGALTGGLLFIITYNTVPFLLARGHGTLIGASGAVYAITVAAATLLPDYRFNLLLIGPVRIKYIALFYIITSVMGSYGGNAGGNIAHLGGAAMGYIYIKQLQSGTDLGRWVANFMRFVKSLFEEKKNIKVSHKRSQTRPKQSSSTPRSSTASNMVNQAEIDAILEKISEHGYEKLSKEEKQKLFDASRSNE